MAFTFCHRGKTLPQGYTLPSSQLTLLSSHQRTIHLYSGRAIPTERNANVVRPIAVCGFDERQISSHPVWIPAIAEAVIDPETGQQVVNCPDCLHPAGNQAASQQDNRRPLRYLPPGQNPNPAPPTHFQW